MKVHNVYKCTIFNNKNPTNNYQICTERWIRQIVHILIHMLIHVGTIVIHSTYCVITAIYNEALPNLTVYHIGLMIIHESIVQIN